MKVRERLPDLGSFIYDRRWNPPISGGMSIGRTIGGASSVPAVLIMSLLPSSSDVRHSKANITPAIHVQISSTCNLMFMA